MTRLMIACALLFLLAGSAPAHDGVPLDKQGMCCKDECVQVFETAEEAGHGYRLVESDRKVPFGRTFHSTNGQTITCLYSNRRDIRCLFIPKPQLW